MNGAAIPEWIGTLDAGPAEAIELLQPGGIDTTTEAFQEVHPERSFGGRRRTHEDHALNAIGVRQRVPRRERAMVRPADQREPFES